MPGGTRDGYDLGLVCLNGHAVNGYARSQSEHNRDFCEDCGEKTISLCPSCDEEIPGRSTTGGVIHADPWEPPRFCGSCGTPYPWTEAHLEAARELAREMEGLDDDERAVLEQSIDDLVRETPKTKLAAHRVKKLLSKAGGEMRSMFTDALIKAATAQAREYLVGSLT